MKNEALLSSLSKGLGVLALFNSEHPTWSLAEMVDETGLNVATVYRILRTMEEDKILTVDGDTRRYRVGPALYGLAYLTQEHDELVRVAHPHLENLSQRTGETAGLTVNVGGQVMVLDIVLTPRPVRPFLHVGVPSENLSMASAKVFLAFAADAEREERIAAGWPHLTPNTIADPGQLRDQLERVRIEGVAYDLEEHRLGICAVAVPVFDVLGRVRAALDVVVPRERFGAAEMEQCVQEAKAEGLSFSTDLGHKPAAGYQPCS